MEAIRQIDHILQAFNDNRVQYMLMGGVNFPLSDADMLQCQMALSEEERKLDRVRVLKAALQQNPK